MSLVPLLRRVALHALALAVLSFAWTHVTRSAGNVLSPAGNGVVHVDAWRLSLGGRTLTFVRTVSAHGQALSANLVYTS